MITIQREWGTTGERWDNGDPVKGNDIANLFQAELIYVPPTTWRHLQHDDTTVSKTCVTARGLKRSEAARVFQAVNAGMATCRDRLVVQPIELLGVSE